MDLSLIRQQLTERRAALEARASKTTRDASHRDEPLSADFAEQAVERENDDVLREIASEAQHEIDLINRALKRIDAGIYGECSRCGATIAEQRLLAVPYTTLCVNCAAESD
ncbi:MAG: TraR/DksA family transcriptional regulator [Pseudomonadota bacterium]|nr:TraR/DksA family transcriptional regulator [Pseudomonadota bacterium]